jgi:hypothetical protein
VNIKDKKTNQQFISDFIKWFNSRVKYAPSIPMGILAAMQPSKIGIDRDYENSPLCVAFNSAIMLGKEDNPLGYLAFLLVYFDKAATEYYRRIDAPIINVKSMAVEHGVSKVTVYNWAHLFFLKVYKQAQDYCELDDKNQTMMRNQELTLAYGLVKHNA